MPLRTVTATRYVTPLREGGSLPAIVEASDGGTYVLKFRGAGQGDKALIAELLAGELARRLELPVPEIVLCELDPLLGRGEPDAEIQALIRASAGRNLALDYLPGSITFDPLLTPRPDAALASAIVWFDALVSNVDRTVRNTNLLIWHRQLYLIDHGAALVFHHAWRGDSEIADSKFIPVKDHVLLGLADDVAGADQRLAPRLDGALLAALADELPEEWLTDPVFAGPAAMRRAYVDYFVRRLEEPRAFAEEAERVRARAV